MLRCLVRISLVLVALLAMAQEPEFSTESQEVAQPAPNPEKQAQTDKPAPAESAKQAQDDAAKKTQDPQTEAADQDYYGVYAPGRGFTVARTESGEVNFSLYFQVRYLNQNPTQKFWIDHFGNERPFAPHPRNDFQVNRMLLMFSGWVYDPKFRYFTYVWTSNSNAGRQNALLVGGNVSYEFDKAFSLYAGIGPMPGTRTNQNVWPYFHGTDRRMADEFFRPAYTQGVWVAGNPLPNLYYQAMVGNNLSVLGIDATELDRKFSYSGGVWWTPNGNYGPRGSFSDYEYHDKPVTRFGLGFTWSPEVRQSQPDPLTASENTVIRLSDGLVAFDEGSLAPGVIVTDLIFRLFSANAGFKYRGFALSGEYFARWLYNFRATGPLPVTNIFDQGFQVQTSYMIWPKHVEAYGGASGLLGFYNNAWEGAGGVNWYPFNTRNFRMNLEGIYVNHSPTGSLYTPFIVGQTGPIFMVNLELFF